MGELTDISTWKHNLGLLPIHLTPNNDSNYVMLNGGSGDFCLGINTNIENPADFYSKSWSANTKNFLVLKENKLTILNWLKQSPETISFDLVSANFNKFYSYLLSKSYKSSKDIVPFIIDIFRQFRNITTEKENPIEALNLLFVLLTSLEEDVSNLDFDKWALNEISIPSGFEYYIQLLKNGISQVSPNLDLIIRHSSGALFQEAQKEVMLFNPQKDLFGGYSNKLHIKISSYSSIHYTPPFLSRTIVENSINQLDLDKDKIKIFDPACGSAEFLIEALKQLNELEYNGLVEIRGWDSSETAINTTEFLLEYEKRTIWGEKLTFQTKLVSDSLGEDWNQNCDLILMNPPFMSWELLNKNQRDLVKGSFDIEFLSKPNQASAFFYKAINSLEVNGVIGCVLPTSILSFGSYKKLRDFTKESLDLKLIGKLGNFVFEDALTDASFFIAKKPSKENNIPTILWTKNEKGVVQQALRDLRIYTSTNALSVNNGDYSIYKPSVFPILKENWKPISWEQNNLLKDIERFIIGKKLTTIEEVFLVKQGIRTGKNPVFKISSLQYNEIPDNEKKFFRPAVDNETIKNGTLNISSYVWYPYNKNGMILESEAAFKESAPFFYSKIIDQKEALIGRARINENNWWHLSEHRAWLRVNSPRLISSEFGRSDSFAFDKKGQFVIERGNAWVPKKTFTVEDYYFYLAIFSSPLFDKLLSIYSKQLAGGSWYDLGKKYTKDIPIPNVHLSHIKESIAYSKLVAIGKEIESGDDYARSIASEILKKYFYPSSE